MSSMRHGSWSSMTSEDPCVQARKAMDKFQVHDPPKLFFNQAKLKQYFQEETTKFTLNCQCHQCLYDSERLGNPRAADFASRISEHLTSVFGLLVYLERPQLIIPFAHEQQTDASILGARCVFKPSSETSKLAEHWDSLQDHVSLARKFEEHMFRFWVQPMGDTQFTKYPAEAILPIKSDAEKIDEGYYGIVYSCTLLQGYQQIGGIPYTRPLARKEMKHKIIASSDQWLNTFANEILRLRNDHIVDLLKVYQHGNTFNLIFPLASGNLLNYLEGRGDALRNEFPVPIQTGAIWKQLHGLVDALDELHNVDKTNSNVKRPALNVDRPDLNADKHKLSPLFGHHMDIKPENILVFETEHGLQLKLSDFGQTVFARNSSELLWGGANEEYQPPEDYEKPTVRKYDIWSLGCVFAEVIAFAAFGREEYKKFKSDRFSKSTSMSTSSNFWTRMESKNGPILKKAVRGWFNRIAQYEEGTLDERTYLSSWIELLNCMLKINQEDRLNSSQVLLTISIMLEQANHAQQNFHLGDEIVGLGNPPLHHLDGIYAPTLVQEKMSFVPARFQASRDSGQAAVNERLTFTTHFLRLPPLEWSNSRVKLRLCPYYAISKEQIEDRHAPGLSLFEEGKGIETHRVRLSGDLEGLRRIHSTLMGVNFLFKGQPNTVELSLHLPNKQKIKDALKNFSSSHSPSRTRNPRIAELSKVGYESFGQDDNFLESKVTVQLWIPEPFDDTRPLSRVILYFEHAIIMIPVTEYWKSSIASSKEEGRHCLNFDRNINAASFQVVIIRQKEDAPGVKPSFPLDERRLGAVDNGKDWIRRDCCEVTMVFSTVGECEELHGKIKNTKKRYGQGTYRSKQ